MMAKKDTRLDRKFSASSFDEMWQKYGRKLYLKALLRNPSMLLSEYNNSNKFMNSKVYIRRSDQYETLRHFGMPGLDANFSNEKFNTYELFFIQCMLLKCFSDCNKPTLTTKQVILTVIDQKEYFDVKGITNYSVRFGWVMAVIFILLMDIISAVLLPFWASFIAIIVFNLLSLLAYAQLYSNLTDRLFHMMYIN